MLKQLVNRFGKDAINSATKYPSILTLHQFDSRAKGKLAHTLTTDIIGDKMYATEKIHGTNVRILICGDSFMIGSRENILTYSGDLYYDPAQGIVEGIRQLFKVLPVTHDLTVIYGELYGGKVSDGSKWYGQDKVGFRVFDVAVFNDWNVFDKSPAAISAWRERDTDRGMIYGQKFLPVEEAKRQFSRFFEFVPMVTPPGFDTMEDVSHQCILDYLECFIPKTKCALSEYATGKTEGVVLRNESRTKIVKLRFEDYEKTLRK